MAWIERADLLDDQMFEKVNLCQANLGKTFLTVTEAVVPPLAPSESVAPTRRRVRPLAAQPLAEMTGSSDTDFAPLGAAVAFQPATMLSA